MAVWKHTLIKSVCKLTITHSNNAHYACSPHCMLQSTVCPFMQRSKETKSKLWNWNTWRFLRILELLYCTSAHNSDLIKTKVSELKTTSIQNSPLAETRHQSNWYGTKQKPAVIDQCKQFVCLPVLLLNLWCFLLLLYAGSVKSRLLLLTLSSVPSSFPLLPPTPAPPQWGPLVAMLA